MDSSVNFPPAYVLNVVQCDGDGDSIVVAMETGAEEMSGAEEKTEIPTALATEPTCCRCGGHFKRIRRGFGRRSIKKLTNRAAAALLFPLASYATAFVCDACVTELRPRLKALERYRPKAPKTKLPSAVEEPPMKKAAPSPHSPLSTSAARPRWGIKPGPRSKTPGNMIIRALQKKKKSYLQVIQNLMLLRRGEAAFYKYLTDVITAERKQLLANEDGPFRKKLTPENLTDFSWEKTLDWVSEKAPCTLKCVQAMFPRPQKLTGRQVINNRPMQKGGRRNMTMEESTALVTRRMGMVFSIMQYTGSTQRNFVQSAIGLDLFNGDGTDDNLHTLSVLGVSQQKQIVKRHADRLRIDSDREVMLWKENVEGSKGVNQRQAGFSLAFDKSQFAIRNRVNFSKRTGPGMMAVEVPPADILPSQQTYKCLRERMLVIVMRLIADNLPALKTCRPKVNKPIQHAYTNQMQKESTMVDLGAVSEDPHTNEGAVKIMDGLHKYIPMVDGTPYPILCCGDSLTIKRTAHCNQKQLVDFDFELLVEAPQEFHKELVFFQDMMNLLMSDRSVEARGTLSHIRDFFSFKSLHTKVTEVKDNMQPIWDFVVFVVGAYITLLVTDMHNMESVEDRPDDYPGGSLGEKMDWLRRTAQRVVDFCWMPPSLVDVKTAATTTAEPQNPPVASAEKETCPFCAGGKEKDGETLVQCSSDLCGSVWFHKGCVQLAGEPSAGEDWYCSRACLENGNYVHCICKEQRDGTMFQCALMDQCKRNQWYHEECLTASEKAMAEQPTWYCSCDCLNAGEPADHVLNYSRAVLWEGLYNITRREAVREGDGEAMTDFWKSDVLLFWERNHPRDFIIGHQFLRGIGGFYPERVREDLKWNRVANPKGQPGGNIGLDLAIQKNDYAEMDRIFRTSGSQPPPDNLGTASFTEEQKVDVAQFVSEYKKDKLFQFIPGRSHTGFENFTYPQRVKDPQRMGRMMRTLAERMDGWRDLTVA